MNLEEIKKYLEENSPKDSEIILLSTGAGPFLYLAVDYKPERKILSFRVSKGEIIADITSEDTGEYLLSERAVNNVTDVSSLIEAVNQ